MAGTLENDGEKHGLITRPTSPPGGNVVVTLRPSSAVGNVVKFGGGKTGKSNLFRWDYVEGNRISELANWKTYTLPSSEKTHLFRGSDGPETAPLDDLRIDVPASLSDIFRTSLPVEASVPSLSVEEMPDLVQLPAPIPSMPTTDILVKSLSSFNQDISFFCWGVHEEKPSKEPSSPSSHVDDTVSEEDASIDNEDELKVTEFLDKNFDFDASIFRARKFEADSMSAFDGDSIYGSAFEMDWERCLSKNGVWQFVSGQRLPHPFQVGDVVEIDPRKRNTWTRATISQVFEDGTINIADALDKADGWSSFIPVSRVRYPGGGAAGGYGGGDNERSVDSVEEDFRLPAPLSMADIRGKEDAQINSIASFCGAKFLPEESTTTSLRLTGSTNSVYLAKALLRQAVEIARVKAILRDRYRQTLNVFHFFRGIGSSRGFASFTMQQNEFLQFCRESGLQEEVQEDVISRASVIFDEVNDEKIKANVRQVLRQRSNSHLLQTLNPDRALMRFEWQEAILRLAKEFFPLRVAQDGLASATEYFLDTVTENLGPETILKPDRFRSRVLYTCSVERVLHSNLKHLVELFCAYAGCRVNLLGPKGKGLGRSHEYGRVERLFE